MAERRRTSTSNFGVGRRESHDATAFYERFRAPELSDDDTVAAPAPVAQPFVCGDARRMDAVADGSVALVVTSPPYFAGKAYEEELEREGVPATYLEYLDLLHDVFAECLRKLEPGGRMAVNVANLGRRPYRSLSADVIRILQDDLGMLLRGEIIWQKAEGASGSCAWGSFRSAANPVLRDVTERVVVASKGRFDRARPANRRRADGLPAESTLMTDDFLALTLDVWSIPPESATRVGHPAPFPVELPAQLIRLYTYRDDLVLDPFMGSGSALVAAARLGRRYVGYDLDPDYVAIAEERVRAALADGAPAGPAPSRSRAPAPGGDGDGEGEGDGVALVAGAGRADTDGEAAVKLAEAALTRAGFTALSRNHRVRGTGVTVGFAARDRAGHLWLFDVAGPHSSHRGGLQRNETVWRALGRAAALKGRPGAGAPVVLLTTALPRPRSEGDSAIRAAGPGTVFDVVDLLDGAALGRLRRYADGPAAGPALGFWTDRDLAGPPPADA